MKRLLQLILLSLVCSARWSLAQTVGELRTNYTGTTTWDSTGGVLTFTGSGEIALPKTNYEDSIWVVPAAVKQIVIGSSVTVTGEFTLAANCTINGQNRTNSILYGTPEQRWADNRGVSPISFSAVLSTAPTIIVSNLTSLNPKGYHVRGGSNNKIFAYDCSFYDTRGGGGNHSDGYVGGAGSLVRNCYFETGDDIIKAYWGTTCYDKVTIKMVQNAEPVQLGWGSYGSGAAGNFTNLTVLGTSGRGPNYCVVNGAAGGAYSKTINIYGCNIQNTNATLVGLYETGQTLALNISDAFIQVKQFTNSSELGALTFDICSDSVPTNYYNCLPPVPPATPTNLLATAVVTNRIHLTWSDASTNETAFQLQRATNAAGPWGVIATLSSNVTAYADSGLPAPAAFWYQVRATNAAGSSAWSASATATTIPAPPKLQLGVISGGLLQLSWSATGFALQAATNVNGTWQTIVPMPSSPYLVAPTNAAKFYRLQWSAP